LAALARLISSLHACAPVEHDVGCRWAEAAEGTRSIAAAMSGLYIAIGRSFQGCHTVRLILVPREMLRVHGRQPQPLSKRPRFRRKRREQSHSQTRSSWPLVRPSAPFQMVSVARTLLASLVRSLTISTLALEVDQPARWSKISFNGVLLMPPIHTTA
jgi:hypothetical protein